MIMNKTDHKDRAHEQNPKRDRIVTEICLFLGCIVGAASYPMFLTPNDIAPGGMTGLATVLHFLFGWPVGAVALLLNVPLLLLALKVMGGKFVFRTIVATTAFTMLIDLLPIPRVAEDPLLGAVYGGVMLGTGIGLILRGGASSGGSDLAASMIHRRFSFVPVSVMLFSIDCGVVLLALFTMSTSAALYSMIEIFISSKTIDLIMTGYGHSNACYVFSSAPEKIGSRIMREVKRGVTYIPARGGFSGSERTLLLSVLSSREVPGVKKIVKEEDPKAFMFITDSHETLGEGFGKLEGNTD